jgi:hypothetical protein
MSDYRILKLRIDKIGALYTLAVSVQGNSTLRHTFIGDETITGVRDNLVSQLQIRPSGIAGILDILFDLSSYSSTPSTFDLTEEAWEKYKEHLKIVNFRLLIDEFKLSDQVALEDAIQVLQEHFLIMPVMNS